MTTFNPTLLEWASEMQDIERLTAYFYDRARSDPLLAKVFAGVPGDHALHVGNFIANVFGDPHDYGEARDGHTHMLARHLGRRATLEERRRWMDLVLESADENRNVLRHGFPFDADRLSRVGLSRRDT